MKTHSSFHRIPPAQAWDALNQASALLLDVRTPIEFAGVHVRGSVNLPLDQLSQPALQRLLDQSPADAIHLLCHSGKRARMALNKLMGWGICNAFVVTGGIHQWQAETLPLWHGKTVISLERQVRIAAGAFVLAGVTLGYLVHPGGFGLAGFVGAGLVFAGITDTCGMGLMLARMPWNRNTPATVPD